MKVGEGNYQYQDSSDEDSSSKKEDNEDGFLPMSSDSDYIGSSDEGIIPCNFYSSCKFYQFTRRN